RAAGVGDANVDAPKSFRHGGHKTADCASVGHVEGFIHNFDIVLLADLFRGGLQGLLVARAHGKAATFRGKGFGGGAANSLTGSCDQRYTVLQAKIHESGIINGAEALLRTTHASAFSGRKGYRARSMEGRGRLSPHIVLACRHSLAQLIWTGRGIHE